MKNIKYILVLFLSLLLITSCQEDDVQIGDLIAPSNIKISMTYLDDTDGDGKIDNATEAPGLGSGLVRFSATADNATAYHFDIQNTTKLQSDGVLEHNFTVLGNNTYAVTVIAYGTGGIATSKTIEVDALALYEPPAELLEMLYANGTRTWKIASEINQHFGLGDVGNDPFQHYGAAPGAKEGSGMYDDRYTFNVDGTFTHDVGPDGFVFGREGLIDELGGSGGIANGADIEQYVFGSYTANWALTAPGGAETLSLTGLGFIGYYVGGNHKYVIHSRSANEMVIKITDGNGVFDWWFRLIPE